MQVKDSVVVITGGGSGLGKATANALSAQGAKVAALDLKFDATDNSNVLSYEGDILNESLVLQHLSDVEKKLGNIDVLINCAGIAPAKKIVSRKGIMPLDDFKRVIDINLVGSFNVMRQVTAKMAEYDINREDNERGLIINTASVAAFEGQIGQTAYSASKGGIVAMTLPAARELASLGIRVNAIAPGIFGTPMVEAMPDNVKDSLVQQIPFPKRFGKSDEYAKLCQHMMENTMLNGEVIRLDGAVRMGAV